VRHFPFPNSKKNKSSAQNIDGNKNRRESANIPEYNLYKMPLATVQANTKDCSPLPQFVHDIMDYITGQADLAEGIFRKSGSKKRIDEIKVSVNVKDIHLIHT
jgi:hypothetical protein